MAEKPEDAFIVTARPAPNGRKVLILTADDVEDSEFLYPYYRLIEEGYQVDVATPKGGEFKGKRGTPFKQTMKASDARPEDYELLYIPGGKAPAHLRKYDEVLAIVRSFVTLNKPVAAFCHGPQVLVEADLVRGRRLAAWPEVEKEIQDAGGTYVSEAVVTDGPFITSRWPGDLPAHMKAVLDRLNQGKSQARGPVAA